MSGMHLYPMGKGDPLCPLGFHPQVRWPTRCKRCFRDYKEHGGKRREPIDMRKDDFTASTPSLGSFGSQNENRRSWASSTTLNLDKKDNMNVTATFKNPSSWTSTPDLANLEDDTQANIPTVSLTLPLRRKLPTLDTGQQKDSKPAPIKTDAHNDHSSLIKAKKLPTLKESNQERPKRIHIKEIKTTVDEPTNHDVQFLIQVKAKPRKRTDSDDDDVSVAGTETTESTTLVDPNEFDLKSQLENMKQELDTFKAKCERLEKEKSNILLRRLTAMDTTKGSSSELLKLQQKVNELQMQLDDHKDEKKALGLKVKELEDDLETRPAPQSTQKVVDELRSKLLAAETLCEELMDENEDMKKELRDLEDEMEEMQDNFREDQADEYSSLKKELEQTTKNCRILSFKLRKTERKAEQLEQEKVEYDKKIKELCGGSTIQYLDKIKQLEKDLTSEKEIAKTLQKKLDETSLKLTKAEENKLPLSSLAAKKKSPMLGNLGKSASTEMKVSRESLTRGGSQDDPVQLLRDLQDSLEREADLREQLKFAEEEAENIRKKSSRIEDDNESLVLQLKKMATRPRTRKLTPTREEKHTDEDVSEMKLQLELSEQETTVLRKKFEDLDADNARLKKKTKELQDKLTAKPLDRRQLLSKADNTNQNDRIKSLEAEMNEIRTKLIEKERDCERLEAEINLSKKRSREMTKSKSQELLDQNALDLKRQLQVIEQEAAVFRNKAQTLEAENEKLLADNKRFELLRGTKKNADNKSLEIYIDKIANLETELTTAKKKLDEFESKDKDKEKEKDKKTPDTAKQIKLLERERDKLQALLDKVKENSSNAFKNRKVHAPTELTTKAQLRIWVNDLENEITAVLSTLGSAESAKEKSSINSKELEELQKKLEDMKKEDAKMKSELDELNKKLLKINDDKESLNNELNKLKTNDAELKSEKKKLEEEVEKLKAESLLFKDTKKQLSDLKDKYESVKKDLDKKDIELKKLKDENEDKVKLAKELTLKTKKISELQKQIKELEDESNKNDKINKDKIKELESNWEDEKRKLSDKDSKQQEMTHSLNTKYDKLLLNSKDLNSKIEELEKIINEKNSVIEKLEKEKSESSSFNRRSSLLTSTETKELKTLKEEVTKLKTQLSESENKFKHSEDKLKKAESEFKTEKDALDKKAGDLDLDLQSERKKLQVMKTNLEKEQKNRELELGMLKNKIKSLEANSGNGVKRLTETKQEYQEKLDKLEKELEKEKKEYENLTAKYEVLEEEHVVTKAKLVSEKEALGSQLINVKREMEKLDEDLEYEKNESSKKYNNLLKEKNELFDKFKKLNTNGNNEQLDKTRLKASLEERQSELEQFKREREVFNDQMEYMRKDNDELRRKLDDYDKVSKIQRNISADSSAMDREIKELKSKVNSMEKSKKSDITECKMRYESQISILNAEMQSLHSQVSRFKRERDTYKHMLEGAQKTIGDLKVNPSKVINRNSLPGADDLEEQKSKVANLEQQISCMEDELSEARLEASRLKTELISERSSWEVKMSELHSRVNELEEERILSSGRTKIAGLRTRMELSWQKEREEQQRILQETATLARDLRQTLLEVERERDKDVLEGKRKMDQLKKALDEEQDDNKKKLNELQCDFMELRDAHAKLRTTNEKLRREKERYEKEREEMKYLINGKRRTEQEDFKRINILVQQVETLLQLAPELFGNKERDPSTYTPTPPKRTKSKSREGSPAMDRKDYGGSSRESSIIRDDRRTQVQSTLQRLVDATDELKRIQRASEERDRTRRMGSMRRSTSTENDQVTGSGTLTRKLTRNDSNLHRKSLSLEHTASMHDHDIWKTGGGDDDSMSSLQSLDMSSELDFRRKRDVSMDSRLSGGSTQSEVISTGEKKKKKGIIGKLKKLTKSRSIDDDDNDHFAPSRPLSSKQSSVSSDINEDPKGSKKDLKDRITGMFKRSGSQSRSSSMERQSSSSTQRPLMRNGSNSNLSSSSKDFSTETPKVKRNLKL